METLADDSTGDGRPGVTSYAAVCQHLKVLHGVGLVGHISQGTGNV